MLIDSFKIIALGILYLFLSYTDLFSQDRINLKLLDAVKKNNIIEVKKLIKAGADLSFRDSNGTPLVMWAAYKADTEMVKFLVDAGAVYNQKGVIYIDGNKNSFYGHLLGIAAGENNLTMVKYFVEDLKVNINEVEFQPDHSNLGWTALEWAFYKENHDIFKFLKEAGALVRPETYSIVDQFFLNTKDGFEVIPIINELNELAKAQSDFSDSLKIYSLILRGRALIKLKNINEGLESIKLASSLTESKSGSFNLLKTEAIRHIALGYLNAFEYDSAINYFHQYFNASPIEVESNIDPENKALIYSKMRQAYRNAGRLNDWEENNKILQKKMDKANSGLFSSFYFTYARLLQLEDSKDEALKAFEKVLENVHEDNDDYAKAALYYAIMQQNLNQLLNVLEQVNHFKNKFPKYNYDNQFMTHMYSLEILIGSRYSENGDLESAIHFFEKVLEGAIKPFFDSKYEFNSYLTKSLYNIMEIAQGNYRTLVWY